MRCNKAKVMLSAALDGELLKSQQAALERHISSCAACAGEKAALSALRDTMSLWADAEPSTWLSESFAYKLRQLQGQPMKKINRSRWVLGTASAGLATAMLAVVFLLNDQVQPPAPVSTPEHVTVVKTQPVKQPAPPDIADKVIAPTPVPEAKNPVAPTRPVAVRPATKEPVHVASQPKKVTSIPRSNRYTELTPRAAAPVSEPTVVASIAQGDATSSVTDNLGEAGLAMNETIERVRGTLRKAADLMVAQYTEPIGMNINPNGGEIL